MTSIFPGKTQHLSMDGPDPTRPLGLSRQRHLSCQGVGVREVSNFDLAAGNSLPAYAQPCVNGEIRHHFRDKRWQMRVTRPAQELRLALRTASDELTQELARAPTDAELARHLQVSAGEVAGARVSAQALFASSLDARVSGEEDATILGSLWELRIRGWITCWTWRRCARTGGAARAG